MEQALEEADRLLGEEFQKPTNEILKVIPRGGERRTYLFSAIMTNKVKKVARAGLRNPVKLEVASKYSTVDTLKQQMMTVPVQYKQSCSLKNAQTPFLACMLQNLGIKAIALHGQMSQSERIEALTMFKAGQCNVLVCTNLASRGLDIPSLDMVINYNVPASPKGKSYQNIEPQLKKSCNLVKVQRSHKIGDQENKREWTEEEEVGRR